MEDGNVGRLKSFMALQVGHDSRWLWQRRGAAFALRSRMRTAGARIACTATTASLRNGPRHRVIRRMRQILNVLCIVAFASGCAALPTTVVRTRSLAIPASSDTALTRIVSVSSPDPALSGFRLLPSGAFALSTRIEIVLRSERSLDLQYYLIQDDATGRSMLRALRDAALRGVRVRLLLDDLNTSGEDDLLLGLAAHPNVEVRLFNPFPAGRGGQFTRFAASLFDFKRINRRMHNKVFIADGTMAVLGGRNIADKYFTRDPLGNFIDLDVFASGAIVPELARQFDQYWNSSSAYPLDSIVTPSGTRIELQAQFDANSKPGQGLPAESLPQNDVLGYGPIARELNDGKLRLIWSLAEAFSDPPYAEFDDEALAADSHERSRHVRFNVVEHMREARTEAFLVSPYFIPGRNGMAEIREMRERGVKITVLTNSLASTDQPLVHAGYLRYRSELLALGVDLYELSAIRVRRESRRVLFGASVGGLHTKAAVFDGDKLFIGSMNFDPRSERYNSEMGVFIHSAEIAREAVRLAALTTLQASHRLRLTPEGEIDRVMPAIVDNEVHTDEPAIGFWTGILMQLIGPLAPEELL